MSKLDKELAAPPSLDAAQLRERWQQLSKMDPPNVPVALLRRLVAQVAQERRLGGLPVLVARELTRAAASSGAATRSKPPAPVLAPGTRLIREWNGQTIVVEVQEKAFVWQERPYRSLSEIAKLVTGAHWSGLKRGG
ncbi:DUF2924 domain-containing protein [Sphingobium sp. B12D2B]|uniref:DUF2924 domain-containing protein n=1 Tax=Sphingobium sp. B12D2B TaxID=2940577 RepID=UPI00222470C4|nr:DUF2924 domain-containing protein [Sphingobium sp. B12D2B]MCW2349119.1 hypothetical protein [Sphingobium sp. B12D2B]